MTVIMHPIEVKCHSFNIAIAEPPYIDNEPPKRHISFLLVCNKAAMFVRQKKNTIFIRKICLNKDFCSQRKKTVFFFLSTNMAALASAIVHFEDTRKAGSELCQTALRDVLENIITSFPYSRQFSQRRPLVFQNNERRLYMLMFQTNSFLMQRLSIVPINFHGCGPRE